MWDCIQIQNTWTVATINIHKLESSTSKASDMDSVQVGKEKYSTSAAAQSFLCLHSHTVLVPPGCEYTFQLLTQNDPATESILYLGLERQGHFSRSFGKELRF